MEDYKMSLEKLYDDVYNLTECKNLIKMFPVLTYLLNSDNTTKNQSIEAVCTDMLKRRKIAVKKIENPQGTSPK